MPINSPLRNELKAFADLEREIISLSQHFSASTATEFVQSRRRLGLAFGALGAALENDDYLASKPELMREASRLLSALRTEYSAVQADWPVVRVKDELAAYREAERPVGARAQAFWQWIEQNLGFKR